MHLNIRTLEVAANHACQGVQMLTNYLETSLVQQGLENANYLDHACQGVCCHLLSGDHQYRVVHWTPKQDDPGTNC